MGSVGVSANGAEATAAVAATLAPHLRAGDAVLLKGELGSGKTTFVKALATAIGSPAEVTSPTFTLAQFYPAGQLTILHIDAYRLSGIHEYRDLGLEEYLADSVTLVEWGDKIAEDFPGHLLAEFQHDAAAPDVRVLTFTSAHPRWQPVIEALQAGLLETAQRRPAR